MPEKPMREILEPKTWPAGVEPEDRLPQFIGLSGDARALLGRLSVLVVGSGSVGMHIALHLARLGVALLGIVDPGRFKANVGTQPIMPADIGHAKAPLVGTRAKSVSPDTRVLVLEGAVQDLSWLELCQFDVCCAATDNLAAEIDIGRRAAALGMPLFYAAVHGESLTAQVRVLAHGPDGPCIGCGFSAAEWDILDREETVFSCIAGTAGDGGHDVPARRPAPPTMSISPLCGLAADLLVLEVVRSSLGLGPARRDALIEYNAYRHATTVAPLQRSRGCRLDHRRYRRLDLPGPIGECTLRQCAAAAGLEGGPSLGRTRFAVDGHRYVSRFVCPACGTSSMCDRFTTPGQRLELPCERCREPRTMSPHLFYSSAEAPGTMAAAILDRPLRTLGVSRPAAVMVHHERGDALVRAGAAQPEGSEDA